MKTETNEEFQIATGAPFIKLQSWLGLVQEQKFNAGRRSILFIVLAAVMPVVLATATIGFKGGLAILTNFEFLTRFVLFIAICFFMEKTLEGKLKEFLKLFDRGELLDQTQRNIGAGYVARAIAWRDNAFAEVVCLGLAAALSFSGFNVRSSDEAGAEWIIQIIDGQSQVTVVGFWVFAVSSTIFWFLFLRWLWRITVWSMLIHWISKLEMRLVATHPDQLGGIGFVGTYPNYFAPFVFGMSSVVAATVYRQISAGAVDVATFGTFMTVWLAIVLALFNLPLLSYSAPISRLKEATLMEANLFETRLQRAAERNFFDRNLVGPQDEAISDDERLPDPSTYRKGANSIKLTPISFKNLLPISVAALTPLLLAGASVLPIEDLLKIAKRLLFF